MQQALEIQGCKIDIAPYILVGNTDHKKKHIITSLPANIQAQGGQERPTTRCWLSQKDRLGGSQRGRKNFPSEGAVRTEAQGSKNLLEGKDPHADGEAGSGSTGPGTGSDSKPAAAEVSVM